MRKIKITALLLAVLMVVTAFAGCASKSTVENLDNKVNDLDAEIKSQSDALKAIQDSLNQIANGGSSSSDKELDDLKDSVEQNEKDVASILEKLDQLANDIKNANDKADAAAGNDDAVKTAISQYGAKIDDLKGKFEDSKANYAAADVVAIREIYGDAQASISICTKADDVKAVYDAMLKKLEAYKGVNEALYDAIVALQGKITDASAAAVEALVDQKDAAVEFYGDVTSENLTEYAVSATEDVNLIEAVDKLEAQQTTELATLKDEAAALVKEIDKIDPTYSYDDVMAVYVKYLVWEDDAEKLSPENVKLVTNLEKLTAAMDSSLGATKALAVIKNSVITSKLDGTKKETFADYDELLANGEQAVFTYTNAAGKTALTSEIYAAIDAAIAAWAKEYALTDAAVEYILNTVAAEAGKGKNYYALYNANKALNASFEEQYNKLTGANGTFTAIKALNSKSLGADAYDVVVKYQSNAWALTNWRETLETAYTKELTTNKISRTVDSLAKYQVVLADNFNAMIKLAKLCNFVPATAGAAAYYDDCEYSFTTYANGAVAVSINGAAPVVDNSYFYLYDFAKAEMATFLRTTYPEAAAAAKLINQKIENYAPTSFTETQTQSIATLAEGIGGYVKLSADGKQLLEVDLTGWDYANNSALTIAQFEYKYADRVPYDLTGMINVEAYNEKIAVIEKAVEKAREATLKLEEAYREIVDGKVTLSMDTYSKFTSLYSLYQAWYKTTARIVADDVSNMRMAVASNVNGVAYDLVDILDGCDYIADYDTLKWSTGKMNQLYNNATKLKNLYDAVTTGYQAMDAMVAFNSLAFANNNQRNADTQVQMIVGSNFKTARTNFNSTGIVKVDISSTPMDRDGIDSNATSYAKDQYKWTITYWNFNGTKFATATKSGYFYGNNASALDKAYHFKADGTTKETAREYFSSVMMGSTLTDWTKYSSDGAANTTRNSKNLALAVELTEGIPAAVAGVSKYGVRVTPATSTNVAYPTAMKSKALSSSYIAALVSSFNSLFDIMNGGAYEKVETAKAKWDADASGYGFSFLKEISWMKLRGYGVAAADTVAGESDYWNEINACKTLDELRVAVADIVEANKAKSVKNTINNVEDTKNFDEWIVAADGIKWGAVTFNSKTVRQYVIYDVCNHTTATAVVCVNQSANCTSCGELITGTTACSSNPAVTCATATGNEVCQYCGLPIQVTHTYATTATITEVSGKYTIAVDYTCLVCDDNGSASKNNIEFNDADGDAVLDDGETVSYFFVVGSQNLTVEAAWDAANSKWVSTDANVTIR